MFKTKQAVRDLQRDVERLERLDAQLSRDLDRCRSELPPKLSVPIVDCEGKYVPPKNTYGGMVPGVAYENVALNVAIRKLIPEGQELVYCRGSAQLKLQPKRKET